MAGSAVAQQAGTDKDPAVGVFFTVSIDVGTEKFSLGVFNSCEGLGFEMVMEQREEGGNNGMVWQLPTRMKFTNIKLSRPVAANSPNLAKWFTDVLNGLMPTTAAIRLMPLHGDTPIAEWSLMGVVPVRWTGPSLNVDSPKVATETIEIAHHGILPGKSGT